MQPEQNMQVDQSGTGLALGAVGVVLAIQILAVLFSYLGA